MSKTYDFAKLPNYTKRQMFLDAQGPVTIQRYDEFAYPFIRKYVQTQKGFFWVPEEITLVKDKIDFKNADEAVRHIFTSNLLRQTALDSIQGRAPEQVFKPVCSVPELEALVQWWSAFEQIHSEAYSHIIRNIYNAPTEEFNRIHDTQEIVQMAAQVGRYYDDLHLLNSRVALQSEQSSTALPVTEEEHITAIWLALNASYALEAIRFMVSFATSLGMVENKLFIGNGNEIALILQDELLHTAWTADIINRVVKDDPRFAAAKERCKDEVWKMYQEVIAEEKAWADYLFKKGTVIGLNSAVMKAFVEFMASQRLKDIGIKYETGIKTTPLPWFNKHLNTSKKQTALQENETTSYVLSSMTNDMDYDELPEV
jgi:ribonucleoside-diphosphate reductase beta chain